MTNINLYKLVSHDSNYADVLVNAPCEQEARFLAANALITSSIEDTNHKRPFDKYQTDFYQHSSNASCIKLLEGIDYEPLLSYGDFISIAIGTQIFHLRKGWTH